MIDGHFDILDSDGYTIMDEDWEDTIEPGMSLTMRFWTKSLHADVIKDSIMQSMNTDLRAVREPVAHRYSKGKDAIITTKNALQPSHEPTISTEYLDSLYARQARQARYFSREVTRESVSMSLQSKLSTVAVVPRSKYTSLHSPKTYGHVLHLAV